VQRGQVVSLNRVHTLREAVAVLVPFVNTKRCRIVVIERCRSVLKQRRR
jgi:hypothetical protein